VWVPVKFSSISEQQKRHFPDGKTLHFIMLCEPNSKSSTFLKSVQQKGDIFTWGWYY
jgi:hypothetical protein